MENKVLEIINLVLENKGEPLLNSLNFTDDLRDDLGLDSLDLAELTVRIEDEFGIDIFSNGLINKVGQIVEQLKV
jgi:acyl carrier protein